MNVSFAVDDLLDGASEEAAIMAMSTLSRKLAGSATLEGTLMQGWIYAVDRASSRVCFAGGLQRPTDPIVLYAIPADGFEPDDPVCYAQLRAPSVPA